MIFLFFGTSLALLEAELAPFKDCEEIDSKQLKNQIYLLRFGHTSALLFKNGHFPRPRETDPYVATFIKCQLLLWFSTNNFRTLDILLNEYAPKILSGNSQCFMKKVHY